MGISRSVLCGLVGLSLSGIAAANNDDGFIWIDANTRIKVLKPVGTAAGGATTPEKAPKKAEKKEKTAK